MNITERLPSVDLPSDEFMRGDFNPRVYICNKTDEKPTIDGDALKPFWNDAPWTEPFSDIVGGVKPPPVKETKCKLLYDDEYLYLVAVIYDDQIWGTVTRHDGVVYEDNNFEFFVDFENSTHNYVEFEINALGTVWDLMLVKPYRDGGRAISAFEFNGMKKAVKVSDTEGWWCVEVALPWSCFEDHYGKFKKPAHGDYYRFNLMRTEWKAEKSGGGFVKSTDPATGAVFEPDYHTYQPTGLINAHYPELWAFLAFGAFGGMPETELIKWDLRKVYYAERVYYAEHGRFAADWRLCCPNMETKYDITVETTRSGFLAFVENDGLLASIREDGYVCLSRL